MDINVYTCRNDILPGTQMRTFRGDIISKPHVYSYGKRIAFIIYQNIVLIEID